jgi:DNA-binding Xre family transcriptional regulator
MVTKLQLKLFEKYGPITAGHKRSGVRYYDIARQLGIYPSRLSAYIHGKRAMPWWDVMAICELLECGPDDILGDANPAEYDLT